MTDGARALPCVLLPGLVMPADLRYAPLARALGGARALFPRDMAVADPSLDPRAYTIRDEVDALDAFRAERGLERIHLYGHSAGGAIALAYVAAHPGRVASLALDEPATDFSETDLARPEWEEMERVGALPFAEGMLLFRRLQVGPRVSAALPTDPPPWMAAGPPRVAAFSRAVRRHPLPLSTYRRFRGPVHYSIGTLTNGRFEDTRTRLRTVFTGMEVERYDDLHHLHSGHQAVPERVAATLERFWGSAERS